jgi:hypothetical protein
VHVDVRRLIGVLVPNLDQALEQQDHRQVYTLSLPDGLADRFRHEAALSYHASHTVSGRDHTAFELKDLADAFVIHFNQSTTDLCREFSLTTCVRRALSTLTC